jgi:hypothetical protein
MKILFCHIPKNAGTSISSYLLNYFGEASTFGVFGDTVKGFYTYTDNIINRYDFISGHIPLSTIESHVDSFDVIFCVVRNPLSRFISMSNYVTRTQNEYSHLAGDFEGFFQHYYLSNGPTRNEQCGYIGFCNTFASVIDRLNKSKKLIILRHEHLEADFAKFCSQVGIPFTGLPSLNLSAAALADRQAEFINVISGSELHGQLFNWFKDDFLLYDYLCYMSE